MIRSALILVLNNITLLSIPVLVRTLQRNTTNRIDLSISLSITYRYTYKRRFITEIDSHGYGGQEALQSAVCKPKNQESQWYNSVRLQRPENQAATSVKSQRPKIQEPGALMSEDRRRWISQLRKREFPLLCPFVLCGPTGDWIMPVYLEKAGSLHSVYWIKCNANPETPSQTHPEVRFYQFSGHPSAQSSWHMKLTITLCNLKNVRWM